MAWLFDLLLIGGTTIVFGVPAAIVIALLTFLWRHRPPHGSGWGRFKESVRRHPWAAWGSGIGLGAGVLAIMVGVIGLQSQTQPGPGPGPTTASTPIATPSATPIPTTTPVPLGGWGPSRSLAKHDARPQGAMLNSVVDDPSFGDERGFMVVRLADDDDATWSSSVVAVPGMVYDVAVIVNNDASEGGEAAEGVRVRVEIPAVASGVDAASEAFVTASNVSPEKIWAGMAWVAETEGVDYALRYVSDSAMLHTGGDANGALLSDSLFEEGVLIGCDALDGVLPAGERCNSWVSFKIRIDRPDFDVEALAEIDGTDQWANRFVGIPGQQVTVAGTYTNTGTTMQDDVTFTVDLPDNMHYVTGSTQWSNASTDRHPASSDEIVDTGINVGSYAPRANATVYFDVIIDGPITGSRIQEIEDMVVVHTNAGSKGATLTVRWP
ncbi:hypothetical protein [Microbacterium atlanticum]|uniref:hypothetical protein n=1 Tax=Microbacterium atlanticum TaxID=2782168 RepID=UPI001887A362|nr:hypothetical protein [Microbacterium atlanticum]